MYGNIYHHFLLMRTYPLSFKLLYLHLPNKLIRIQIWLCVCKIKLPGSIPNFFFGKYLETYYLYILYYHNLTFHDLYFYIFAPATPAPLYQYLLFNSNFCCLNLSIGVLQKSYKPKFLTAFTKKNCDWLLSDLHTYR